MFVFLSFCFCLALPIEIEALKEAIVLRITELESFVELATEFLMNELLTEFPERSLIFIVLLSDTHVGIRKKTLHIITWRRIL